jgi:23S rRNA (guanosine2251-2'-O)-methyltransferase
MREWITGRNPVFETLQSNRRDVFELRLAKGIDIKGRVQDILRAASRLKTPTKYVQRSQLDPFGESHQGVALQVSGYPYSTLPDILEYAQNQREKPFLLILDVIQNPQNLGTLLRTAEAAGVHGVLIPYRRAAGVTPAVVSASAGASEYIRIAQMNLAQAIDTLKAEDIWVYGLDGGEGSADIFNTNLDGPIAVVVGSEGSGMRALVRKSCDHLVRLPMAGNIESLNAASAGSIALYLVVQVRFRKNKG